MSVFDEGRPTYTAGTPARRKSVLTSLMLKLGAKNEAQATLMLFGLFIVLVVVGFILFKTGDSTNENTDWRDYSDQTIIELLERGLDPDDLSPEQREELDKRGILY